MAGQAEWTSGCWHLSLCCLGSDQKNLAVLLPASPPYPLLTHNPSEIRKEPHSGNTSPHLTRLNREQLTAYKDLLESLILTHSLEGPVPGQGGEEATSFLVLFELLPLRDCSTLNQWILVDWERKGLTKKTQPP